MFSYGGNSGRQSGPDYGSLYKSLFGDAGQASSYNPQNDIQAAQRRMGQASLLMRDDHNFLDATQHNTQYYNAQDDLKFAQQQAMADQQQQAMLNQQKMQMLAQLMQQRNQYRYQYGI
jgi:hypothetical protein